MKRFSAKDEDWFWDTIAQSRIGMQKGDYQYQIENLTELLRTYSPKDIIRFDGVFNYLLLKSYQWKLWGAIYIVEGGCGDDSFDYFRSWLISNGKQVFYDVLSNPENLVKYIDPNVDCSLEEIAYCASDAYEEVTGEELPENMDGFSAIFHEPSGKEWREVDLPKMLPQLWKKFSNREIEELSEEKTNRKKQINPDRIAVKFDSPEVPRVDFWIHELNESGYSVCFRIYGDTAKPLDKMPYPDYSGYLIQLKDRVNMSEGGILVQRVSFYDYKQPSFIRMVFEKFDDELYELWIALTRIVAKQENAEIASGDFEFSPEQWNDYLLTEKLPE